MLKVYIYYGKIII